LGDKIIGVDALSERQKEILRLIAQHLQAKEIARVLKISESTVKTHTDAARKRLGVATSRDAARLVIEHDIASGLWVKGPMGTPIPLEGGWPPRPMAHGPADASSSGHEQALHTEITLLDGPLERSGDSLAHAGLPGQAGSYRAHPERRADDHDQRRSGEGGLYDDRRDGLADGRPGAGRGPALERWLTELNPLQWLGLIVLAAILLPLLGGVLIEAVFTTMQAIHEFRR
jgi:DNA-binding CsgD family transcriptional regulator